MTKKEKIKRITMAASGILLVSVIVIVTVASVNFSNNKEGSTVKNMLAKGSFKDLLKGETTAQKETETTTEDLTTVESTEAPTEEPSTEEIQTEAATHSVSIVTNIETQAERPVETYTEIYTEMYYPPETTEAPTIHIRHRIDTQTWREEGEWEPFRNGILQKLITVMTKYIYDDGTEEQEVYNTYYEYDCTNIDRQAEGRIIYEQSKDEIMNTFYQINARRRELGLNEYIFSEERSIWACGNAAQYHYVHDFLVGLCFRLGSGDTVVGLLEDEGEVIPKENVDTIGIGKYPGTNEFCIFD